MHNKVKIKHGLLIFLGLMVSIYFIGSFVQEKWGVYGVVITELIILLFAVLPIIFYKIKIKDVMPIKKPTLRETLGVLLLWGGTYIIMMLVSLVLTLLFPQGMTQVSSSLQTTFTSVPMAMAFLIIACLPAICEELFHRGFLLYAFGGIKNKWLRILAMAIMFGLFHLDIYRFLPTAILGATLTYIMIVSQNILLPVLFHFVNNALTTYVSFLSSNSASLPVIDQQLMIQTIGSFLIISAMVPFLLFFGVRLLQAKKADDQNEGEGNRRKKNHRMVWIAGLSSFALLLVGSLMVARDIKQELVFETNITMDVTANSEALAFPMEIKQSGHYVMEMAVKISKGISVMAIMNESNEPVYQTSCSEMTNTTDIDLEKGTYTIVIDFLTNIEEIKEYFIAHQFTFTDNLIEELNLDEANQDAVKFSFSLNLR